MIPSNVREFSEKKLHAILEVMPMAVAFGDKDGNIEFFNQAFTDLFGYRIEDMPTTMHWFNTVYLNETDRNKVRQERKALHASSRLSNPASIGPIEVDVLCKDRSICTVKVRWVMMDDIHLAVFEDVTQTNKREKAMKESEQRFRAVFNGAKDGMLVTDKETLGFHLTNKAMQDMLGYTDDELKTLTVRDIHPEYLLNKVLNEIKGGSKKQESVDVHIPFKRKNGDIVYANVNSGPIVINGRQCMLGIFRDSSERKRHEEEVLRERDFSNAVLNSMPGMLFMLNKNNRFLRWNKNFEKVTGYSAKEVMSIDPRDMFEGDDVDHITSRIEQGFALGDAIAEAVLVSKNGSKIPYYFSGKLSHIGGEPCLLGMGIDLTRKKQGEKLQALGQLAGGVAHDFNNQLSAILGFAEILADNIEDSHLKSHAQMIAKVASRSADLTGQLLSFARKGKYQTGPVDIHRIITDLMDMLKHSIDKKIRLKKEFIDKPTVTLGDANQIHNALLNLALNGRDAMPDGGTLCFSTSHETIRPSSCKDASFVMTPGSYVVIKIKDTGIGMDKKTQQHMYEPFYTTKDVGEGTGMGLSAVYGTITNHKGFIHVKSEPGQGSTFYLYLPLNETPEIIPLPEVESEKNKKKGAVILVVDDEAMIRKVTSDILKSFGHKVLLSCDGRDALKCYAEHKDTIDLVLLDLMMPVLNGFETFVALKQMDPDVKVILSSGFSMDGQIQSLLQDGALEFLQKPFTVCKLKQLCSHYIFE